MIWNANPEGPPIYEQTTATRGTERRQLWNVWCSNPSDPRDAWPGFTPEQETER